MQSSSGCKKTLSIETLLLRVILNNNERCKFVLLEQFIHKTVKPDLDSSFPKFKENVLIFYRHKLQREYDKLKKFT